MSRQHLTDLLSELAESALALVRWKPNGKFAPWLFRFGSSEDEDISPDVVSATGDTSLYRDSKNKTIFSGRIEIEADRNVYRTPWAKVIKEAKLALPCWNVDTQAIWDRFLAFNQARGNAAVPAGFLLGFMRRWRECSATIRSNQSTIERTELEIPQSPELVALIRCAPTANRQFHASDLSRLLGQSAYDGRVRDVVRQFGCPWFAATLAVHGGAVRSGEISK